MTYEEILLDINWHYFMYHLMYHFILLTISLIVCVKDGYDEIRPVLNGPSL